FVEQLAELADLIPLQRRFSRGPGPQQVNVVGSAAVVAGLISGEHDGGQTGIIQHGRITGDLENRGRRDAVAQLALEAPPRQVRLAVVETRPHVKPKHPQPQPGRALPSGREQVRLARRRHPDPLVETHPVRRALSRQRAATDQSQQQRGPHGETSIGYGSVRRPAAETTRSCGPAGRLSGNWMLICVGDSKSTWTASPPTETALPPSAKRRPKTLSAARAENGGPPKEKASTTPSAWMIGISPVSIGLRSSRGGHSSDGTDARASGLMRPAPGCG